LIQDQLLLHFADEDIAMKDQLFVEKEVREEEINRLLDLNKSTLKKIYSKRSTFEIFDAQKLMERMYPDSEAQIR